MARYNKTAVPGAAPSTTPSKPTERKRGELTLEDWDLSGASAAERTRAEDPVKAFDLLKGSMKDEWRETLAAFVHDGAWRRLATSPSTLESYKKLKGNAGRQKQLFYAYWFEVATYFSPSHAALQPICEEMSTLWGVDFPADRIFYPKVGVKKEKTRFQGAIEKPARPALEDSNPTRQVTTINCQTEVWTTITLPVRGAIIPCCRSGIATSTHQMRNHKDSLHFSARPVILSLVTSDSSFATAVTDNADGKLSFLNKVIRH